MITTSYILKIHSDTDISLPNNGVALLTALDKALEDNSFELIYKGDYNAKVELTDQEREQFVTFVLFEFGDNTELPAVVEQIKALISNACCPEIVEATQQYQLVRIDSCPVNFKM
jgi:hypothetical protein